ncbi:MAG: nucleotidyltransferase family protein [Candidatus Nezhaarchaeales archaeon]
MLLKAIEMAKENKVLLAFCRRLIEIGLRVPDYIYRMASQEVMKKRLYEKCLTEIIEASEQKNIEFLVFKSIKPFPYVGDDIDLLLPNEEDFKFFIELLEGIGYQFLGCGPSEATLEKRISGVSIQIDVHRKFSASYFPYLNRDRVWANKVKAKLNGYSVYVPSPEYDVLIVVGHSLIKEFRMKLSEFYHFVFSLPKIDWGKLNTLARIEKMDHALLIFGYVASQIYEALYSRKLLGVNFANNRLLKLAYKAIKGSLKDGLSMPYYYPILLPFLGYLDKLKASIFEGKRDSLDILLGFLKAPFTNREGINILWKYIAKQA